MIDLHSHILPGIDDGSPSMKESVNMCRIAFEDGIRTVVATPHYKPGFIENSRNKILRAVKELNGEISKKGIDLEILPGCEALAFPELPELIKAGEIVTLNNSGKYLLLELPCQGVEVDSIKELIFKLEVINVIPIIAHPERYVFVQKEPEIMREFVNLGALGQITSSSLCSGRGSSSGKTAGYFLERGLAHIIASDAHNCTSRKPALKEAFQLAQELVGTEKFKKISEDFPLSILKGHNININHVQSLEELNPKKPVLKRIFGFLVKD